MSRFGAVSGLGCREDLQKHQLLAGHCRLFTGDALLGGSARFGKQPSRLMMERCRGDQAAMLTDWRIRPDRRFVAVRW